jgi:hypothetical protein
MSKRRKKSKHTATLGGLTTEQIEASVDAGQSYERAHRAALALMNRGFHLGGLHSISREELHKRFR